MIKPLRLFLQYLYDKKGWAYRPWTAWIFITFHRHGTAFPYKGDEVWWTWPWRRHGLPKYISVGFSGTGEFGDARFNTLKELDAEWDRYEEACKKMSPIEIPDVFGDTDYK